jgi:hypothetical protein
MKLEEISNGIFHVEFKEREKMAKTFMKLYGYYESPQFRGKIFTEKQFERWFRLHTEMGEEYGLRFQDIAGGFNVPDYSFKPFLEGKFSLIEEEKNLLKEILKIQKKKFIIISSLENDGENFKHELSHGLFYMRNNYKKEIITYFKKISRKKFNIMENILLEEEIYSEPRLIDEMQANLLTSYHIFISNKNLGEKFVKNCHEKIEEIFSKYISD